MNTRAKGRRNERKVIDRVEDEGYETHRARMTRYGPNDFFGLFDILALKPDEKPRFIQVKSNTFAGKNDYEEKCLALMNLSHSDVEAWIWHDREGFRVFELTEDGWRKIKDER